MKVLMLGWELPPHYVGGMGVVCYSLCEHLAKSGADIEFILPFEGDYSAIDFMRVNSEQTSDPMITKISYQDLDKVNATAYGKANISTEQAMKMDVLPLDKINGAFLNKIARTVLLGEFDIIHAHDWLTLRGAMLAKRLTNLPLVVHIHATEFDRSGSGEHEYGNEMIHQIEYEGMMIADKVIAVSQWTKDIIIRRYGIPADKIEVVHNSIDLNSPYIRSHDDSDNSYEYLESMKSRGYGIVINVGRQSIQKGLPNMLEAAKLALKKNPKLLFVFGGSGDMHEELIELAATMGISKNVIFTGFVSGKKLRDLFKVADLFVMPSVSEPFGSTPLESIGLGTPVLISHQSGVSEIIDTALKVDFWDTNSIADKIVAVTSNPALRKEMVLKGHEEFNNYSWVHSAQKTLHTYNSVKTAFA